jgi:YbbR domain-containing protein
VANVFEILKVVADKLEVIVEDKSVQLKLSVDPCSLKVLVVTVLENDQPDGISISKLDIATGEIATTL